MKLQGISISVVRNEYEYNKYVSEEYRKQYDYEASKSSLPWIIIDFAKYNTRRFRKQFRAYLFSSR